jgi:hypothetical protein
MIIIFLWCSNFSTSRGRGDTGRTFWLDLQENGHGNAEAGVGGGMTCFYNCSNLESRRLINEGKYSNKKQKNALASVKLIDPWLTLSPQHSSFESTACFNASVSGLHIVHNIYSIYIFIDSPWA